MEGRRLSSGDGGDLANTVASPMPDICIDQPLVSALLLSFAIVDRREAEKAVIGWAINAAL